MASIRNASNLHMLVESNHVAAKDAEARRLIEEGAKDVFTLLNDSWRGLDRIARQL